MTAPAMYECEECANGFKTYSFAAQVWTCKTCGGTGRVPDRRKGERRESERRKG